MINQQDVLTALHNLMGRRSTPSGEDADLKRYCQRAFDYAWRYYKWAFSLKTADVAPDGSGDAYLPEDFDLEGYRQFYGATEVTPEEGMNPTLTGSFHLEWDNTEQKYKALPATSFTMVYQTKPPTLTDNTYAPFPSAMTIAIGASVYAKQGENPSRADISQEWDEFHAELDRHVSRAYNSTPRRQARNYHDKMGTFTGDVGV